MSSHDALVVARIEFLAARDSFRSTSMTAKELVRSDDPLAVRYRVAIDAYVTAWERYLDSPLRGV